MSSGVSIRAPWLERAELELLAGIAEVPGPGDNPRIVEYLQSTTLPGPWADNDETAWCAAFVCWCIEQAGFPSTDSARARSFLRWGVGVSHLAIPHGAVVILKRGRGEQPGPEVINAPGHVGFFVGMADPNRILMLGGNQSNAVQISAYAADRILGVRWAA